MDSILSVRQVTEKVKQAVEARIENPEMSEHEKITSAVTVRIPDESVKARPTGLPDVFAGTGAVDPGKTAVPTINVKKKSGIKPLNLLGKVKDF